MILLINTASPTHSVDKSVLSYATAKPDGVIFCSEITSWQTGCEAEDCMLSPWNCWRLWGTGNDTSNVWRDLNESELNECEWKPGSPTACSMPDFTAVYSRRGKTEQGRGALWLPSPDDRILWSAISLCFSLKPVLRKKKPHCVLPAQQQVVEH